MHKLRVPIKILITAMTVYYVAIPTMADIGESHLDSDEWSDHARVHLVWFLTFTGLVGFIGVVVMWLQDAPAISALIGLSFNAAFLFAGALASRYDGVISDADGIPIQVIEFGALAIAFAAVLFYLAAGNRRSSLSLPA